MEGSESVVFLVVHPTQSRQLGEDVAEGSNVTSEWRERERERVTVEPLIRDPHIPKSSVVKAVEAVVIGDGDIGPSVKQQSNHVVSLLGDGVVERCVPL